MRNADMQSLAVLRWTNLGYTTLTKVALGLFWLALIIFYQLHCHTLLSICSVNPS
jgi:hypothetical protein